MNKNIDIYEKTLSSLQECVLELKKIFPDPEIQFLKSGYINRHLEQTISLAAFLKIIRISSLLNGALILIRAGYAQEVNILARCIEETNQDIQFLLLEEPEKSTHKKHYLRDRKKFLEIFYRKELKDLNDSSSFTSKETMMSREDIRRHIGRAHQGREEGGQAERYLKNMKTIYRMHSGFLHSVYEFIMELYDLDSSTYSVNGNTPLINSSIDNFSNCIFRSIHSIEILSLSVQRRDIRKKVALIKSDFAKKTGCLPPKIIEELNEKISSY